MGKAFLSQLANLPSPLQPSLVLVSRSTKAILSPDYKPLDVSKWSTLLSSSSLAAPKLSEIADYLASAPKGGGGNTQRCRSILVDNTSDQKVAEAYPHFLSKGVSIVTPNKKAFSSSFELWQELVSAAAMSTAMVYHESSVGAGLPIISTLKDLLVTGDEVLRIEGIFSGTMSYLFNTFAPVGDRKGSEAAIKWSDIVIQAKDAGFTEPDPREDLNGMDVARKLTILARLAGLQIAGPMDFPVQSLIPQALQGNSPSKSPTSSSHQLSTEDFLKRLPEHDQEIESYKSEAKALNKVVRYVGSIDLARKSLQVGLKMVEPASPIATLKGSDNLICFYTRRYGIENPLVIQGAGAGAEVTAMGVTADLIRVIERLRG